MDDDDKKFSYFFLGLGIGVAVGDPVRALSRGPKRASCCARKPKRARNS